MSLQRRTPLQRGKPLKRTKALRTRKRLRAKLRDPDEQMARDVVAEQVYRRDGGCLLARAANAGRVPACFGRRSPHHLRKEGQGGPFKLSNIVELCTGHNDWVEQAPHAARKLGLVIVTGEPPANAWDRMLANGLVSYGPDGRSRQQGDPL